MKRLAAIILIACFALCATTAPATLADITGDNATHAVSGTSVKAWVVDITALSTNGAACRVGDSNTGSSRGQIIAAGGSFHFQGRPSATNISAKDQPWDLSTIYYWCGTGDKLAVMYAPSQQ